jgi:hypothetical protein
VKIFRALDLSGTATLESIKINQACIKEDGYVITAGRVNISSYLLGFRRILRWYDIVTVLQKKRETNVSHW